jgi:anti-anti-sigma factor
VDGTNAADDWAAKALTRTTQADAADYTDGRQELEGLPPARATPPARNSRKRARFESRGGQSGGRPGANRRVADRSSSHRTKGATHDASQDDHLSGEHAGVPGDGTGPLQDLPEVGDPMLGVDIAEVGDVAVCHVAGDLGRTTASRFAHALPGWVGRPGLVIDLSDLLFRDGAGLPALVGSIRWARELAAEVVIACDARPLPNVLECVGLSPIVRVSDRTEDALAEVRSGAALRRLSPQTPPAYSPPTGPSSVTFRVSRERIITS